MTILAQAIAPDGQLLDEATIKSVIDSLRGKFTGQKVLVLIPDHTRSLPLPQLFRLTVDALQGTAALDFMVALGTHPPMSDEHIRQILGITEEERKTTYKHVRLLNHDWDKEGTLVSIGTVTQQRVKEIAGERWHPTLGGDVDILINRAAVEADQIVILGPTFPHEVVGFSGGAKYLFPGISGSDMINVTHWLGALAGVRGTIGVKDTPVRAMIHEAATHLKTPVTLIALIVQGQGLGGMFLGDHLNTWNAAADLSSERHIVWVDKPFKKVLSCAPAMYDELWTGGKAMYKIDPAVANGGEVIIYAPHLDTVSIVHGKYIAEIGYHTLPYFLHQWDKFKHIPLGVIAHSTHVSGDGEWMADEAGGHEVKRVKVTLASKIPPEECAALSLGYMNPDDIDIESYANREDEGVLLVRKAGETLYRYKGEE